MWKLKLFYIIFYFSKDCVIFIMQKNVYVDYEGI